jgi:hypothetical protein
VEVGLLLLRLLLFHVVVVVGVPVVNTGPCSSKLMFITAPIIKLLTQDLELQLEPNGNCTFSSVHSILL